MAASDLSFVPSFPGLDEASELPPRSALFALEPIGIGTSAAEGLISYIVRLAEAYSVGPRRLIRDEFSKVCPDIGKFRHGPFFERDARTVNGLHRYSRWFAETIKDLCMRPDARYLTLLPLAGLLPHNGAGLIASRPRWCPACYSGMLDSPDGLHQPLVWSFDLYRICPKHKQPMVDQCPNCGKAQYPIPRSPGFGFCSHCGGWLGGNPEASNDVSEFDIWTAQAIGEIVANLPKLDHLATRKRFMQRIGEAVDCIADGNRAGFCREIGLPQFALKNWLGRDERPSLPQWLAVSYGLSVGPVELLEMDFSSSESKRCLRRLPDKLKSVQSVDS